MHEFMMVPEKLYLRLWKDRECRVCVCRLKENYEMKSCINFSYCCKGGEEGTQYSTESTGQRALLTLPVRCFSNSSNCLHLSLPK